MAAIIAALSVQPLATPGLWAVELTVVVDASGSSKLPLRSRLAKKDETLSPRIDGRNAPAPRVKAGFLPDEIPLELKSLFPLFSAEPVAPSKTTDKSKATTNMDSSSVRRGLSRGIE